MFRVLSLGGAGFIGSYMARELLASGSTLTVVDNFSKYGPIRHAFFDDPACTVVDADVREMTPEDFAGYDCVLVLAALIGGIRYFHRIPYRIARDNTDILTHAIDCTMAAAPQALFVYFSSSMVYERMQRPVTEEDALKQPVPLTNYGMQKLFGEFVVRGAREELGLRYLIVRPFNAVGSGELPAMDGAGHAEYGLAHVIPDLVYKAIKKQNPFEIFGDGEQVRTFTHAADIATGVRKLLETGLENDDFNICGSATVRVADLARTIWTVVNPSETFPGFRHLPVPVADVRMRIGVSAKLQRVLGWKPEIDLEWIVADTYRYIAEHVGP